MNATQAVSHRRLVTWLIVLTPALALLGLILRYAVDVPISDDWFSPGLTCVRILDGDRDYYDIFFRQFLECRNAFPRLISVACAFAVGWHSPVSSVLGWVCAFMTFLVLLRFVPGDAPQSLPRAFVALLVGGLMFSPIQWANLLWATQFMQFIPALCLVLGLWLQSSRRSVGFTVACCVVLNTLATFSPTHGMLCWVLGFPFLLIPFTEWKSVGAGRRTRTVGWLLAYAASAILVIGFYFWDYEKPYTQTWIDSVLESPASGLVFLLTWVGAPLVEGLPGLPVRKAHLALFVGAVLIALLAFALLRLWRSWRRSAHATLRAGWPWVCLAGLGVATGVATTIGRFAPDAEAMMTPRYYTQSLCVTIGLVGLGYVLWSAECERSGRVRDSGFAAVAGVLSLLTLFSWIGGLARMEQHNTRNRQNQLTLRLLDVAPANPLWKRLSPASAHRERARFLMDRGVLRTERIGSWIVEKVERPDAGVGGRFRILGDTETRFRVQGWAVLPNRGDAADCVILVRMDSGEPEIVSGFITGKRRPDFGERLDEPDVLFAGFDETLEYVHYAERRMRMFAVDLDGRRLFPLDASLADSEIVSYSFAHHLDAAEAGKPEKPVRMDHLSIAGDRRRVLTQLANSDIVFRNVFVGTGATLEFEIGVDQLAGDMEGGGVRFEISVRDQGSRSTTVFSRRVDPDDRRWLDSSIDLEEFAGQEVDFRFRITGHSAGEGTGVRVGWSRLRIVDSSAWRRGGGPRLQSLSFVSDTVRIDHPMIGKRLEMRSRSVGSRDVDVGVPVGTRFSSSAPEVIEVLGSGRLIAHRTGAVQIVATHGELEARVRVEADWARVIRFGVGTAGKDGIVPVLDTDGERLRTRDPDLLLEISNVVGGARGMLFTVADPAAKSIPAGPSVAALDGVSVSLTVNGPPGGPGRGSAQHRFPIPGAPEFAGTVVYLQAFFQDPGAANGWSVTNGLLVTIR